MDSRPKLLVALGLEGHDAPTVRYASKLCEWLEASTITFVHVLRRYELDHAPYRVFPDLRRSILDAAGNQCRALVEERGSIPKGTEVRYEVLEGSPAIEVARAASQTDADLVLVGRKDERSWTDHMAERISRKVPCSVLVVPESAEPSIAKVLVAVDFSNRSRRAVEEAALFARSAGAVAVRMLHAFSIPVFPYAVPELPLDARKGVAEATETEADTFRRSLDLGAFDAPVILKEDTRPPHAIREAVDEENADLVVLGSKGRTDVAALLLGSVAEKAVGTLPCPVFVVRAKGDTTSFLKELLGEATASP